MPSNVRRELHIPLALTLTLALLGYHLKLLTLIPGKAWSSVLNRKGYDALASQSCCVPLDHSFYSHTSGPAVPRSSHPPRRGKGLSPPVFGCVPALFSHLWTWQLPALSFYNFAQAGTFRHLALQVLVKMKVASLPSGIWSVPCFQAARPGHLPHCL